MENLMAVFKKWINILVYFLVVLLCSCNANKSVSTQEKEMILKITFSEYYENDSVDLFLNNQQLLKDRIISNSKLFSGPVGVAFVVFKEGKHFYAKELGKEDKIYLKKIKEKISFNLIFNNEKHVFNFDLKEGKWFVVYKSKMPNSKIEIHQHNIAPWF